MNCYFWAPCQTPPAMSDRPSETRMLFSIILMITSIYHYSYQHCDQSNVFWRFYALYSVSFFFLITNLISTLYRITWNKLLCLCTAKNQYRKLEINIPRKGIPQPQSQFPHSCVCERLYFPSIDLPILLQEICGPILGIYKMLIDTWIWKLGLRSHNFQKRKI